MQHRELEKSSFKKSVQNSCVEPQPYACIKTEADINANSDRQTERNTTSLDYKNTDEINEYNIR